MVLTLHLGLCSMVSLFHVFASWTTSSRNLQPKNQEVPASHLFLTILGHLIIRGVDMLVKKSCLSQRDCVCCPFMWQPYILCYVWLAEWRNSILAVKSRKRGEMSPHPQCCKGQKPPILWSWIPLMFGPL